MSRRPDSTGFRGELPPRPSAVEIDPAAASAFTRVVVDQSPGVSAVLGEILRPSAASKSSSNDAHSGELVWPWEEETAGCVGDEIKLSRQQIWAGGSAGLWQLHTRLGTLIVSRRDVLMRQSSATLSRSWAISAPSEGIPLREMFDECELARVRTRTRRELCQIVREALRRFRGDEL